MPVCARAIQQPDGTLLLALDPTNQNLSTCQYLVEDGASNAWRELGNLSLQNAQEISVAVGLLWAMAWGFRTIGKAIPSESNESES